MADTLLKVSSLKVAYGGIQAVKGVSFEVRQGELVSLIGANGAGKTTTLKAVSNLLRSERGEVTKGSIEFKGQPGGTRIDAFTIPESRSFNCYSFNDSANIIYNQYAKRFAFNIISYN